MAETEATDGDLPQGAGFREPPPDPQWRILEEPNSDADQEQPSMEQERARKTGSDSADWSKLRNELRQQPLQTRGAGLTRYRQSPGSRKSLKRFRKGIVIDEAG